MSVVIQERFREHVAVAEALRANYSSKDDLNRVHAVQQLESELSELCNRQEKDVQAILRELTKDTAAVEAVLQQADPPSVHLERVEALQTATTSEKERVAQLEKEKRFLQDQKMLLKEQFNDLQTRSDKVEELVTDTEPRTRHELSLYVHITNISWNLQNAQSKISGKVHSPATKDIRYIDLDPQEKSQFDIINSVWETLG